MTILRLVRPEPPLSPAFLRSMSEVRRRIRRHQRWKAVQARFGWAAFFAMIAAGLAPWFALAAEVLAWASLGLVSGLVLVTLLRLLEEA